LKANREIGEGNQFPLETLEVGTVKSEVARAGDRVLAAGITEKQGAGDGGAGEPEEAMG
jgi:hypothetical protein